MKQGASGQASLYIDAPPEALYHLISDVPRMGEWSPECRACTWLDGATGPAVGARFSGTNRRRLVRWTTNLEAVTASAGREFAFVTFHRGDPETKWTYRFDPRGTGTIVTESFELLHDLPWYLVLTERVLMGITDRRADLEAGMRETLRRLKTAAEDRQQAAPRSSKEKTR